MRRALPTLLAALVLSGVAAGPAGAAPTGTVTDLDIAPGQVQFLLTASGLPAGTHLSTRGVTATLDGAAATATAEPPGQGRSGAALPPRAVMVVLDSSGSMRPPDIEAARRATTLFLHSLPGDVAAGFTDTAVANRPLVQPTRDRKALITALGGLRPGGRTALYDAMLGALAALDRAGTGEHRLVVLSDGGDDASKATLAAVTRRLAGRKVPVDAVAFRTAATSSATLRAIAGAAGGRLLSSPDAARLSAAFTRAAGAFEQDMWVTVAVPRGLAGRRVRLAVTAKAGAARVRAATVLAVPGPNVGAAAATGPAVPPAAAGPAGTPGYLLYAILGMFFLAIAVLVIAVAAPRIRPPTMAEEIALYGPGGGQPGTARWAGTLLRGLLGVSRRAIESGSFEERLARDLERAGFRIKAPEWVLLVCGVAAALIVVLFLLTGNLLAALPVGLLLGWGVPRVVLSNRMDHRLTTFSDQLPDALQVVASSLRSGFTVSQSLERLAQQDVQPLATEIGRAVAQTRLGVGVEDALEGTADRMRCPDLRWVVMAIHIQREVGGNLADVIETTVNTMRERTHLRRQVRALSAEGRLSAYVLIALPIFVIGSMALFDPGYIAPLFHDPVGVAIMGGAFACILAGWAWMQRIIKVEV